VACPTRLRGVVQRRSCSLFLRWGSRCRLRRQAPSFSKLAGEMFGARYEPATGLLPNGKVLIAGGYDVAVTPHYPGERRVVRSGNRHVRKNSRLKLNVGRDEAASVALPGGKVLIAGGYNETIKTLGGGELFHPAPGNSN